MEKLDLKQQYKTLYAPSARKVEFVDVPDLNFAMIDGAIEPGTGPGTSPLFQENMQVFAQENGYTLQGKHHEIYLGNPLRADPEKLKTILRHAVR